MFAPYEFVATRPSTPTAAAVSRVVVVLPFVPETSATARPDERWASRSGSILRPIQPPITEPSPRPAALESAAAVFDTEVATLAMRGIFPSVTPARVPDAIVTASCQTIKIIARRCYTRSRRFRRIPGLAAHFFCVLVHP